MDGEVKLLPPFTADDGAVVDSAGTVACIAVGADYGPDGYDAEQADAQARAEMIAAALSARPAAGEWQPIESAPKDGEPVDLWIREGQEERRVTDARWLEGCWQEYNERFGTHYPIEGGLDRVTHWMRPAPPASQTRENGDG